MKLNLMYYDTSNCNYNDDLIIIIGIIFTSNDMRITYRSMEMFVSNLTVLHFISGR